MTKAQWMRKASKNSGMTQKDLSAAYDAIFQAMEEALLAGEEVQVTGFGTFSVANRPARTGRNPKTGEILAVPASRRLMFSVSKGFKAKLK